ncbi:hypothetical protein SpCBS45565_g07936 [Spizellomyces sp. 'palustris']|nr:hypothetical protein SpCBS45565_g07936 [Spizellomyces sp. 'palustris']
MRVIVETSILSYDTPTEPASQSCLRSTYSKNLFRWNIGPPSPADLVGDKQRHPQEETQKDDSRGGSSSGERDLMVTTTLGEKHVSREGKRPRSRDGPPESTNMHCCKANHWLCYRLHYGKPKPEEIKPDCAKNSVRRRRSLGGVEQRPGQKRRRTQSDRVDIPCKQQRDKTPVLQEISDGINTSPRNPSSRTPLGKRNNARSPTPPLQRPVVVPRRPNIKRIAKFFAPTNSGAFTLDEDAEDRGLDLSGDAEDANRGSRTWHFTIPEMQARPSILLTQGDTQALFEGQDSPQLVSDDDPIDMTVAVKGAHVEKDGAEENVREGSQTAVLPKLAAATRSESMPHEAQPRTDFNDVGVEGAASMALGQNRTHNETIGLRGADEDALAISGDRKNGPENAPSRAPQYAEAPFCTYPEPILTTAPAEAAEVGVTAEVAAEVATSAKTHATQCGSDKVSLEVRNTAISPYSGQGTSVIDSTPKQGTHDPFSSLAVPRSASTVRQRTTLGNIKPAQSPRTKSPLIAPTSTVSKPRLIRRQRDIFDFPGSQEDEDRVFTLESEGDKDFTEKKPSPRVSKTYRSPKRTVPVSHVTSAARTSAYHCNVTTPPSKGRRQPNSLPQPASTATTNSFTDVTPEAGSKDRDLRRQDSLTYLFDSPIKGFTVSPDGSPLQTNQVESLTQNFDVDANMLEIEKFLENDVDLFKDVRSEFEVSEAENGDSEED